jgi:hypothetical protein
VTEPTPIEPHYDTADVAKLCGVKQRQARQRTSKVVNLCHQQNGPAVLVAPRTRPIWFRRLTAMSIPSRCRPKFEFIPFVDVVSDGFKAHWDTRDVAKACGVSLRQANNLCRDEFGYSTKYRLYADGMNRVVQRHLANCRIRQKPTNILYKKGVIPVDLRWEVWERDNFTCQHCGARRYLCIDHIYPESRGGQTVLSNLQTLCKRCNAKKSCKIVESEVSDARNSAP